MVRGESDCCRTFATKRSIIIYGIFLDRQNDRSYDGLIVCTQAEPLYLEALEICDRALGPEHPNTIKVRENLERFRKETAD